MTIQSQYSCFSQTKICGEWLVYAEKVTYMDSQVDSFCSHYRLEILLGC